MKTEQDIRKFMQENRIPVPKDSAFMDDLLRQINSLPVPASLAENDARVQENIRMVKMMLEALKKRSRRQAAIAALVSVAVSAAICTAGCIYLTPSLQNYILIGVASLGVTVFAMSRTELV